MIDRLESRKQGPRIGGKQITLYKSNISFMKMHSINKASDVLRKNYLSPILGLKALLHTKVAQHNFNIQSCRHFIKYDVSKCTMFLYKNSLKWSVSHPSQTARKHKG